MKRDKDTSRHFEPHIGRSVSLDHAAAMFGGSRRTIDDRIRKSHLQTIRTASGTRGGLLDSLAAFTGQLSEGSETTSGRV